MHRFFVLIMNFHKLPSSILEVTGETGYIYTTSHFANTIKHYEPAFRCSTFEFESMVGTFL